MDPLGYPLSRRRLLALAGAAGGALALAPPASAAHGVTVAGRQRPIDDPVGDAYLELLHVHTRWVERQWDPAIGAYRAADFRFVSVLGNAVLLTTERYDADLAGVDAVTLKERTLATIRRYAATNRLAGGTEWGRQLFWDTTFELYFILAARLLWADLDTSTRSAIDQMGRAQAAYAYGLGTGDDPLSGGWTPNGSAGAWRGDTKLEEMGVYAQAIAPGLAWGADDAAAPQWRQRFLFWTMNASGLPAADRANPAIVDGRQVAEWNVAHNIHDTFIVENHDSVNPHYQAELWRTAGRAAIHFIAAGQPLPQALTHQPNGRELWGTLRLLASDAGEPVMPMVADRYHLYGRDVLPLAFLAQVQGDRHAARAEADLAQRLMPYLRYPPEFQLTKFSGEEKYEPEARAELAIAYLFHRWRAERGGPIRPVPPQAFFEAAAGTRDFGVELGMTVQQSVAAFAAAVTKPGFVRFLWQAGHDNWLFDSRAATFLPARAPAPVHRWSSTYQQVRDGVDATVTVLGLGGGFAGYTTLPTGTVVYATTGIGVDEGGLSLFNLAMPGVPGLTGSRTFTGEQGSVTLSAAGSLGDGGTDEVTFAARQARHVRVLGRAAATQFGYSLWTFSVLDGAGTDLARSATASASSADTPHPAANAVDGNPGTRWAVARAERGRPDSWLAADLGTTATVTGVRLGWEAAYGTSYLIQTSLDGQAWTDAAAAPDTRVIPGAWVDVDGRAGLVVRGADNPIAVTATRVIASAGPAAGSARLMVEGYAGRRTSDLAAAARRPQPTGGPPALRVSDADRYLSLLNLSTAPVTDAVVALPSHGTIRLYRGVQVTRTGGTDYTVTLAAGTGRVEPPRFTVNGKIPGGTRFETIDSRQVRITAPAGRAVSATLRAAVADPWIGRVRVPAGATRVVTVPGAPETPTADLARGRTTFPTSPLPAGMTEPARAVDGDPHTAWRPGPTGRMVVDLGAAHEVTAVSLSWAAGRRRAVTVEVSVDGLTYAAAASDARPGRVTELPVNAAARYLAVVISGWRRGDAELIEVAVGGTRGRR